MATATRTTPTTTSPTTIIPTAARAATTTAISTTPGINAAANMHPAETLGYHNHHAVTPAKTSNLPSTHRPIHKNPSYHASYPVLPIKNPYAADPPSNPEPHLRYNRTNGDYSSSVFGPSTFVGLRAQETPSMTPTEDKLKQGAAPASKLPHPLQNQRLFTPQLSGFNRQIHPQDRTSTVHAPSLQQNNHEYSQTNLQQQLWDPSHHSSRGGESQNGHSRWGQHQNPSRGLGENSAQVQNRLTVVHPPPSRQKINDDLETDNRLQPWWNAHQHFSQGNTDEPPHIASSSYEGNSSSRNGELGHDMWMTQLKTNINPRRVMDPKKELQTLTHRN